MTKVFISYSRKDTNAARKIVAALETNELDAWVDWEDIPPTADWLDQIHKGIEDADAFLFLLSPDSVLSKVCVQEIEHAAKNNKRLIPLVVRDVSPDEVHPALAKLNWIFFREGDNFKASVKKLDAAIKTDLAWVEAHRRLQVRALEWNRQQNRSLLLRGDDLRNAEEMLASAGQKDPQPTDLQRHYVLESRRRESRTRGMVVTISIVASIILAIAAIIAVIQSNTATSEANSRATAEADAIAEANSRATAESNAISAEATTAYSLDITQIELRQARVGQLSAQAELLLDQSPATSLLLSLEAVRLSANAGEPVTDATLQALRDSLSASAGIPLPGNTGLVLALAISPDGRWLASAGEDSLIHVWDLDMPDFAAGPAFDLPGHEGSVTQLAFLPGDRLASAGEDNIVRLWVLSAGDPAADPLLFTDAPSPIDALAVSPDGRWLAVGSGNQNAVRLWDLSADDPWGRTFLLSIRDSGGGARNEIRIPGLSDLVFSPDSQTLAAAKGLTVAVWRLNSGSPVEASNTAWTGVARYNNTGTLAYPPRVLAFTPDSRWLLAGADTGIVFCAVASLPACSFPQVRSSATTFNDYVTLHAMAISPDGNWLAAGYSDSTIKLWDISAGFNLEPTPLEGHSGPVTALAFSPESRWLASSSGEAISARGGISSGDGITRLWDLASDDPNAAPIALVTGSRTSRLAFAPDGDWLAASSDDTAIRLFDLRSLSFSLDPLNLGNEAATTMTACSFENNDRWLWYPVRVINAGGINQGLAFLDLTAGDPLTTVANREARSLLFSPDDQWMAYNRFEFSLPLPDYNNLLQPVDAFLLENVAHDRNAEPLVLWPAEGVETDPVQNRFSPDSRWLLHERRTWRGDPTSDILLLYDLSAPEAIPTRYRFDEIENSYAINGIPSSFFTPDNRWLVSNNTRGGHLFDLSQDDPTASPLGMQDYLVSGISPDGRLAAVVHRHTGDVGIMDMAVENPPAAITILKSGMVPVASLTTSVRLRPLVWQSIFSPDDRWFLLAICEKSDFDENNRLVCSADAPRSTFLWDLAQADPAASPMEIPAPAVPREAAFSSDSRWLVTADTEGAFDLISLSSGETALQGYSAGGVLLDPQNRWLVTQDGAGNAALVNLADPTEPAIPLNNQGFPIAALAFNQDGTLLAGAAASGRVLLWDMTVFTPDGRALLLTAAAQAFGRGGSPADDRLLIADGPSASITAWHLDFEAVLDLACQAAGHNLTLTEWRLYGFSEEYRATCPQWPLDQTSAATPTPAPAIMPTPTVTPTSTP